MRYVILGAGAIGGTLGSLLSQAGKQVLFVARGPHAAALQESGLTLRTPSGAKTQQVNCISALEQYDYSPGDVILLCVKTQDVVSATDKLDKRAPIVCVQNGVEAEDLVSQHFAQVYAMMTWLPALHLEPGVVHAYAENPAGVLRVGNYRGGTDSTAESIAQDLSQAGFQAESSGRIMDWKYTKLLLNLGNVVDAFAVAHPGFKALIRQAVGEGQACLRLAKHKHFTPFDFRLKMDAIITPGATIDGQPRPGGSTWQSAKRGQANESQFINGWIVDLGDQWGIPVPANRAFLRIAEEAQEPRSIQLDQVRRWIREDEFPS